jgi:hypothetical protein
MRALLADNQVIYQSSNKSPLRLGVARRALAAKNRSLRNEIRQSRIFNTCGEISKMSIEAKLMIMAREIIAMLALAITNVGETNRQMLAACLPGSVCCRQKYRKCCAVSKNNSSVKRR